jgi:DNA adenine methylase
MEISLKSPPTNSVSGLNQEQKSLMHYVPGKDHEDSALSVKRNFNRKNKTIGDVPYPFLKWAGGKRSLLFQFDAYFPNKFNKYIEPFVGGGSVFFYLLPEKAILMDNNDELINCYLVIQNHIEELISSLKQHRYENKYFYKIRNVDRNPEEFRQWTDIERASRTIYLNKCCYNGLYRVNSKGEFNVPFGLHKNPNFCDERNLRAVHQILKNVKTFKSSFEKCLDFAEENDFLYFDPPYQPLSETANFTAYTKEGFAKEAQIQLSELFGELDRKGCKIMLSNSYNKLILELYQKFRIITVNAKRAINSIASKRGEIKEVLIVNY